jgi:hypothetical protein
MQGPRICLGSRTILSLHWTMLTRLVDELAMLEMTYILFRMAQRFERLDRVDKDPWVESISIGTTSANGAKVVLVPDEKYAVRASA